MWTDNDTNRGTLQERHPILNQCRYNALNLHIYKTLSNTPADFSILLALVAPMLALGSLYLDRHSFRSW